MGWKNLFNSKIPIEDLNYKFKITKYTVLAKARKIMAVRLCCKFARD